MLLTSYHVQYIVNNRFSLGGDVGSSGCSAPSSYRLDWQKETTHQKQILQIVQNQLHPRQQESVTAR